MTQKTNVTNPLFQKVESNTGALCAGLANSSLLAAFDDSTNPVCFFNCHLTLTYNNQSFETFYEKSGDALVGRSLAELIGNRLFEESQAAIEKCLRGSLAPLVMTPASSKNSPLEFQMTPQFDALGHVVGFFAIAPRQTNQVKRQSDVLKVFDHIPAFLFYVDRDLVIQFASQGSLSKIGYPIEDVIGKSSEAFIGPEAYKIAKPHLLNALQGNVEIYENCVQSGFGTSIDLMVYVVPDRSKSGAITGLYVISFDITPIKQTEQELKRISNTLELAVKGKLMGVWERQPQANPHWLSTNHIEQILDLPAGHLQNDLRKFDEQIHPDDVDQVQKMRATEYAQNNDASAEFRIRHADGVYRWMRSSGRAIRDEAGNILRIAGTVTDIDKEKQAQLSAANEIRRRDLFLAMLSHELRNPMTAIYHAIYYAKISEKIPPDLQDVFDIIDRQSEQLANLMDNLLDVSRITRDKLDIELEAFDLDVMVEEILLDFATKFELRDQTVQVKLPESRVPFVGDRSRLQQVVANLLDNANKYTEPGGCIDVELVVDDEQILVSVKDNGIGIDPSSQNEIFNLFFQNQLQLSGTSGLGVGLFLVRRILQMHRGDISVSSDGLNRGSTFTFWLPQQPSTPSIENEG